MLLLLFNDSLSAVVVTKDLEDCQTKYCNKNKLALQPPNNEQINGFAAKKFRSSHVSCMCVCTLMYELGDKSVDFRNFKQKRRNAAEAEYAPLHGGLQPAIYVAHTNPD